MNAVRFSDFTGQAKQNLVGLSFDEIHQLFDLAFIQLGLTGTIELCLPVETRNGLKYSEFFGRLFDCGVVVSLPGVFQKPCH